MPRILLFGTGSIGILYGWVLTQSPAVELTAICRSNYDALKADGFHVDSTAFGNGLRGRPKHVTRGLDEPGAEGPWDFVMVAAKALPGTAAKIRAAIDPSTTIVLLQNGIFIEDEYAQLYPNNPIVSVVVSAAAIQSEPGHVVHHQGGLLSVGAFPASDQKAIGNAKKFTRLLKDGGATAHFSSEIQGERWRKVMGNAAVTPICALTRSTDFELCQSRNGVEGNVLGPEELVASVMQEVGAVARAEGYGGFADNAAVHGMVNYISQKPPEHAITPSMLQDVRNGNRLEVESILGNVVRKAYERDIAVPSLEILYVLTRALDLAIARGQTKTVS